MRYFIIFYAYFTSSSEGHAYIKMECTTFPSENDIQKACNDNVKSRSSRFVLDVKTVMTNIQELSEADYKSFVS